MHQSKKKKSRFDMCGMRMALLQDEGEMSFYLMEICFRFYLFVATFEQVEKIIGSSRNHQVSQSNMPRPASYDDLTCIDCYPLDHSFGIYV